MPRIKRNDSTGAERGATDTTGARRGARTPHDDPVFPGDPRANFEDRLRRVVRTPHGVPVFPGDPHAPKADKIAAVVAFIRFVKARLWPGQSFWDSHYSWLLEVEVLRALRESPNGDGDAGVLTDDDVRHWRGY
jgi:hypothetical protein